MFVNKKKMMNQQYFDVKYVFLCLSQLNIFRIFNYSEILRKKVYQEKINVKNVPEQQLLVSMLIFIGLQVLL